MKFMRAVLSVLIFSCLLVSNAFAGDSTPLEARNADALLTKEKPLSPFEKHIREYGQRCDEKINLGVPNLLMGWTTLITEPADHYRKKESRWKDTMDLLPFLGKGLLLFPIDTLGGALNVATFPIPGKIPLPKNGVNIDRLNGNKSHHNIKP